ncbi:Crp/Fnr family transcriptional regulator [Thalassococcus profundi]|uniref:Crp/Fnr family transcriptional regulator n=1 Tax=Thalassococcus profundi TaxID=2282382 RepID=A0A369TLL6_9RHOB|nr:Crp/Fnr family transcriptional regulator [Thalassococcus profundi]RDD65554.1 Crp/Fnr family transcriptional regulator [Thalassococcus profundi]
MSVKCINCPLRKSDLFHKMSSETLEFMQRFKVGEMEVEPGTPLLSEGSNAPQLYTALSGMGLRYKLLENGSRQVISFVFPGDFLGLQAGVMKEMTHSVEATTAMKLCVFDRKELWSLFRTIPDRGFDLAWLAATEERFLGEALTSVGQKSALERMSWALARIFRRLKATTPAAGDLVRLPYRQQDLADALGLSLVHTNKTLAKLRERQLATWSDGKLSVPNLARLEELALIENPELPTRPLM